MELLDSYHKSKIANQVRLLDAKFGKGKIERGEITDQLVEIIDTWVKALVVDYKRSDYYNNLKAEERRKAQGEIEEERGKLQKQQESALNADVRFIAAQQAVNDLCDVAGAQRNPFILTQLTRSIGMVWSAALGLTHVGGTTPQKELAELRADLAKEGYNEI